MRTRIATVVGAGIGWLLGLSASALAGPLSPAELAAGWTLYTGPTVTSQWRGYGATSFPAKGWRTDNGELAISKGAGGGDLITVDQFADVEMAFEFKLGEKSNSGIMWRVAEQHPAPWMTGPEYQILDDGTFGVKPTDSHSVAAMYDLYPPAEGKKANPAGQWNQGRIRLRNGVIQHWINGVKAVEARIFDDAGRPTDEWAGKIAASKFKEFAGFGVLPKGSIAIQDHGDTDAVYRHIRIRDLAAPLPGEVRLFDGKGTDGWHAFSPEVDASKHVDPLAVLTRVEDGVLTIKGQPIGYIRTDADFTNFVLRLQWRFDPAKGAGNSGVLVRMIGEDKVWPKSVEAQLHSGQAGDFWNIGEFKMETAAERRKGRNTRRTHTAERPLGEWNEYEIIVNRGEVILLVNGEELNRATGVEEIAGKICLQSEGAEIQFRDIRLAPIP